MRYYTFAVASPLGAVTRIGAEARGRLVDLTAACAALFENGESRTPPSMPGSWSRPT